RLFLSLVVHRALKAHLLKVIFQFVIGLGFSEHFQFNDYVHVARAGMRCLAGRELGNEVTRCEPAYQVDGLLPRSETTQERDENALAVLSGFLVVPGGGGGLWHQNPILSRRRCSAISRERPPLR